MADELLKAAIYILENGLEDELVKIIAGLSPLRKAQLASILQKLETA